MPFKLSSHSTGNSLRDREEPSETSHWVSDTSTDQNRGLYSTLEQMASPELSPASVNAVIIHWSCTANVLYNLTRLKMMIREREHQKKIWSLYFPNNYGGTPQSSAQMLHLGLLLKPRLQLLLHTSSSNLNSLRDFLNQSSLLQSFIFQRFNDFIRGNT